MTSACLLLWAIGSASTVWASEELARQRQCLGCHAVERKLVGPALRDVAARYKGQPEAVARLSAKIQAGGAGSWGVVPMPANHKLTPQEAQRLAAWVLTLR